LKLSVTTLAWRPDETTAAAALLKHRGVAGVEIAPTSVWGDWPRAFEASRADLPESLKAFETPSLQSIAFGSPELTVFGAPEARRMLVAHLGRVLSLASRLGAKTVVFGSPKNRVRGSLSAIEATRSFKAFLDEIGPIAAGLDVSFCVEANPERYGCDFITNTRELLDLLDGATRPGIGLHIDVGAGIVNGEDLASLIVQTPHAIKHVHISEPGIGPFGDPAPLHAEVAGALAQVGYHNWISIEMLRGPRGLEDLAEAIDFAWRVYGTTVGGERLAFVP
jgi:sugar phosphate isomerase/epimerase